MSDFFKKYKFYIFAIIIYFILLSNDTIMNLCNLVKTATDYKVMLFYSILIEGFISLHYAAFVIFPVANTKSNPKQATIELFVFRAIVLLVADFTFIPAVVAGIDFFLFFIFAFVVVPIYCSKHNPTYFSGFDVKNGTYIKDKEMKPINNTSDDLKYELSTCLVNYLFALSEKDKDMIKSITTNKMYEDTLKIIETYSTYNKKNVIDNVNIKNLDILFRHRRNNDEIIHADIMLSAVDYMEYASTAINGRCNENYRYKVIFRKNHTDNTQAEKVDICPYCGASVDGNKESCNYCGNMLVEKKNEWLIEKLEKTLLR